MKMIGYNIWQPCLNYQGALAQSAPRSPSKGEIMGSIPIGAIHYFAVLTLSDIFKGIYRQIS